MQLSLPDLSVSYDGGDGRLHHDSALLSLEAVE